MIIRNRRKRESLFRRLLRPLSSTAPLPGCLSVLSPSAFQDEVAKEIFRSNRRKKDPEFGVISIKFCDPKISNEDLVHLIDAFGERLRVTDSLGWHQLKLSILLPETDRDGAGKVAYSLDQIALEKDIDVETTLSIYPWDDSLIGEFKNQSSSSDDDQGSGPQSPGNNGSSLSEESFPVDLKDQEIKRFDSGHGGVALMAPPKLSQKLSQVEPSKGTGNRYLFAASSATPVWKRGIDIAGAGVGLVMLAPLFVGIAALIKLSSKGPVFFRQKREGKDGQIFHIFKFRTMVPDAELKKDELRKFSEQDGPAFKLTHDPRVTVIGQYLRKSCVDELPQLINVLLGHMSMVGPRPLPVNESQACLPWQRQRLSVLPGMTCIWQARGGRDIKFNEWMRMDMEYIRNRGFIYDIRLIGETAYVVLLHRGSV